MKSLDFWLDEFQIKVILALIVMIVKLQKMKMDTNAEDRSRAYATGPDFILNYLFLSCRGTGPIFV